MRLTPEAREYFRKQGARGGKLGAKARMEKLTPEQRSAIAKHAVSVRESKRNGTAAALVTETEPAESASQILQNYNSRDGADQRNHERNLKRQEKRLAKGKALNAKS